MKKLINYSTPRGEHLDICLDCQRKKEKTGSWFKNKYGEEFCNISRGIYDGEYCDICDGEYEHLENDCKVYLINSSVITSDGTYSLETIGAIQFACELKTTDFISTIGYQETADLVADMIGKPVPVSREQITMKTGDVAYVVKLKYRINDPKTKGQVSYSSMDYQFQKMVKVG